MQGQELAEANEELTVQRDQIEERRKDLQHKNEQHDRLKVEFENWLA